MLGEWYETAKSYLWGPATSDANKVDEQSMSHLARVQRVSSLLQGSAYKAIHHSQLANFYSTLIKQYPQSSASMELPSFLYQSGSYTNRLSFSCLITIKTDAIDCDLKIVVIFPEALSTSLPDIIVQNPDYLSYKPRQKVVCISGVRTETQKYRAIYGGLQVALPAISENRWNWNASQYYIETNVLNMVKWVHKQLLPDFFPFSKRKQPPSYLRETGAKMKEALEFRGGIRQTVPGIEVVPLLANIQDQSALLKCIEAQTREILQKSASMKQTLKDSQDWSIDMFYPQPSDPHSEALLEATSSLKAYHDVESILERKFNTGEFTYLQFKQKLSFTLEAEFEALQTIRSTRLTLQNDD